MSHSHHSPPLCVSLTQVQPTASSLNTNDVFVLKSSDSLYLWKGKGAAAEEMDAAKYVADLLGGAANEVDEASEPSGCCKKSFDPCRITM